MDKFQTISWKKFYKLAVHNLIFPRRKNGFILNTFKLVIVFFVLLHLLCILINKVLNLVRQFFCFRLKILSDTLFNIYYTFKVKYFTAKQISQFDYLHFFIIWSKIIIKSLHRFSNDQ